MKIIQSKMRDIRQLLSSNAGPDRIADYTFRSAEEVDTYIKGLDQQVCATTASLNKIEKLFATETSAVKRTRVISKVVGMTAPVQGVNKDKLRTNYALLADLQHKLEILQSLEVTISHNFRADKSVLAKNVIALRGKIQTQRDRALNGLESMAQNKEPVELKAVVKAAVNDFRAQMKDKFQTLCDYTYVTTLKREGDTSEDYLFNHYVQATNLVNDQQDFTYQEYYVVLSAVVTEQGRIRMFATTLHDFHAPGAFSLGQQFESTECLSVLNSLLLADEFVPTKQTTTVKKSSRGKV
jgi:hypothetical protein